MISPESIEKHIAYVMEVTGATGRASSRQVASSRLNGGLDSVTEQEGTTNYDTSRLVEGGRYVTQLEGEVKFLRDQIGVKDVQIKDLTERARETNHLIAGLQKMLSPLLSIPSVLQKGQKALEILKGDDPPAVEEAEPGVHRHDSSLEQA